MYGHERRVLAGSNGRPLVAGVRTFVGLRRSARFLQPTFPEIAAQGGRKPVFPVIRRVGPIGHVRSLPTQGGSNMRATPPAQDEPLILNASSLTHAADLRIFQREA